MIPRCTRCDTMLEDDALPCGKCGEPMCVECWHDHGQCGHAADEAQS